MSLPLGHLSIRSCSLAAKSKPGKDAGSARSRRLRARLRTRHGAALQRARGREMVGWWPTLEQQSSLACCIGERLHSPVVEVAAAVEHGALDLGLLRALGQQLAYLGRLALLVALEGLRNLQPAGGRERATLHVVDELRGDAAIRARDHEARPFGRPRDLAAHALVTAPARFSHGQGWH